MPQFDVYANPGRNTAIPFVVQIQSSRLSPNHGRVVMSMPLQSAARTQDTQFTPFLTVMGLAVFANPFDISTIPLRRLGPVPDILPEPDQDRVMRALDEMNSRA